MKILVTGASGFMGHTLCDALEARGDQVTRLSSKKADLTVDGSLKPFQDTKYDKIFHLAAWTQAGDFCLHHPGEQWVINQKMNTNVLTWWQQYQPQARMIAIGTSCSYATDLPLTEDNYLRGEPIESLYTYAMTKRMMLIGLRSLSKQFGLEYNYFVPSTLYGPGYHTDGRQLHFIFDLIRKIMSGKDKGTPVVLWGDGHQKRELVYNADFISAMLALDSRVKNEIVNIGFGEEHTIREFASAICENVGYNPKDIQYDTSKYVGAKSKCLDISKLKKIYPEWKPTPLSIGLKDTIGWFAKNKSHFL